ncbi:14729_t:CDS:2 [Funneliformis caledonium]|uniref:14729_t:CDS:1 n=1 Tax=Funneliformis caledonium TaxID=1117310 RepID=A0A9N9FBK1_9GLOM|nr:14729_t:CDS:2 [Funneliformis caledonium]
MLVRYTTVLGLHRPSLHTWPSQSRNTHTHISSYAKDSLKAGVRKLQEDIKEGAKKDLSTWKITKWVSPVIILILFDRTYTNWYNNQNERNLFYAFEHGFCPNLDVEEEELIDRKDVIKEIERILKPPSKHSSYHVVVGNHGTGRSGNDFIDDLAKAISFRDNESFIDSLTRNILGKSESYERSKVSRVLNAFDKAARKYKANNGKPPVLILDNISKMGQKNVNMLEDLQDIAKLYADQHSCVIVFVSSERTVPRMMMQRSSWSRADKNPIVIGDLTNKEAFTFLHGKLGIEKKVANQLIQLLSGRIYDLKTYGDRINRGETFDEIRKTVLDDANRNFHQARMMEGERNHVIGKVIVQELVKNEKIHFDAFIKLVNNEQIADELLQANVFSYNPESGIATFQSHATEVFARKYKIFERN